MTTTDCVCVYTHAHTHTHTHTQTTLALKRLQKIVDDDHRLLLTKVQQTFRGWRTRRHIFGNLPPYTAWSTRTLGYIETYMGHIRTYMGHIRTHADSRLYILCTLMYLYTYTRVCSYTLIYVYMYI